MHRPSSQPRPLRQRFEPDAYLARKGDRWYAVVYGGIDPARGRERRKWHPAGSHRADAERLAAHLASVLDGRNDKVRALTFGAYLTTRWRRPSVSCPPESIYDGYHLEALSNKLLHPPTGPTRWRNATGTGSRFAGGTG